MADAAQKTPRPWRSLGSRLRKAAYSINCVRRQKVTEPSLFRLTEPATTPSTEPKPAEAEKIPEQTPRAVPQQQQVKANSTNGRRVGLSRLRKDVRKKRLDFADTPPAKKPVNVNQPMSPCMSLGRECQIAELKVPTTKANQVEAGLKMPDQTPRTAPQQMMAKTNSSNARRLGLPRVRKDVTKKRLEFTDTPPAKKPVQQTTPKSQRKSQWRERQIALLKADIETWRNGFKAALEDLQSLLEPQVRNVGQVNMVPQVSKKEVLQQLKLPLEMLRYLAEED